MPSDPTGWGFTHNMQCYDLSNGTLKWENTDVNTWMVGAVGASMVDGQPRELGGWYGRTVYVLDGDGNTKWSRSLGGGYKGAPFYAGNLRRGRRGVASCWRNQGALPTTSTP